MGSDKFIEEIVREVYDKVNMELNIASMNAYRSDNNSCIKKSGPALAAMIDHTLLKAEATAEQVKIICMEACEYKFASVCVNSSFIPMVSKMLRGTSVKACSVIGFPLGAATTRSKAEETKEAIENGATEVDMVINIGAIKAGDFEYVKNDIEAIVNAAKGKSLVKVILETCLLTDEEKVRACIVCKIAGADFVKTSTGFNTGGATVEDIKLMRLAVGPVMGVKASGGVKDYQTTIAMIEAGASRIGTSSGITIIKNEISDGISGNCIKSNY